jgi:hypothetical protein
MNSHMVISKLVRLSYNLLDQIHKIKMDRYNGKKCMVF